VLAASLSPTTLVASQVFRYVPPFGIVPLQSAALRGFNDATFFTGVPRNPLPGSGQATPFIDMRQLPLLRAQALELAPTDLRPDDPVQREFVWVYRPWQNAQALQKTGAAQPVMVFASGLCNDLAIARFDLARADFSNFADCCGAA